MPGMPRRVLVLVATAALLVAGGAATPAAAAAPTAPAPAAAGDAWSWLSRVRISLAEAGPTGATFTQTYVPAGFTSGEKETGSLSLHLPDCLRWDYRDPYPRGFLLCGEMVHAWNPEDHTGRRYRIDRRNEPGLDLLLLGVDDLKARYSAVVSQAAPAAGAGHPPAWRIALTPKSKGGQLTDAALTIDPATLRVVEVSYHDQEGNLTRFQIGDYRPLTAPGQFAPPANIRWDDTP
jgi:outer membrane lipoprotein-sorting protein